MANDGAIDHPLVEGTVRVGPNRVLGFAEFGDPNGLPCLWFHGTPGGRRQVAPLARVAASQLGVRIICIERPGAGWSTPHEYGAIVDFATDVGVARTRSDSKSSPSSGSAVVARTRWRAPHAFPHRVVGVGVMGGVAPVGGLPMPPPAVWRHWPLGSAAWSTPSRSRSGWALRRVLLSLIPLRHQVYDALQGSDAARRPASVRQRRACGRCSWTTSPARSDRAGWARSSETPCCSGETWGFSPADITVPVRWWHGDEDSIVPLRHGQHVRGARSRGADFHLNAGRLPPRAGMPQPMT